MDNSKKHVYRNGRVVKSEDSGGKGIHGACGMQGVVFLLTVRID